jgi:4-amino-4-deoxy-L-arabinose transferase-like glycosyltransferase
MHPGPSTSQPETASPEDAQRRALLLLTLAAIVVRAAFLLLEPATGPAGDERTWTDWAKSLASPRVAFSPLRTHMIFYPPLYPYFLGVPWSLSGGFRAAQWAQLLVGSLLVPAVGLLGARAFSPRVGLVAAGIVAFYPEVVWFSVHFWSETLFMVFLWWGMERLLAADAQGATHTAVVAGLLWGLAALTRETVLYFLPLAAGYLMFRSPLPGGRKRALAFLLAAIVSIAPWTYRNWLAFHAFVPVSTAGGLNLFQGNARLSRQEVYDLYEAVNGRIEQYRFARQKGIEAILERQPLWILEKLRDEMPRFWEADSLALIHIKRGAYGEVPPAAAAAAALVVLLPYLAVVAGLVAGLARMSPRRPVLLLVVFLVFYNGLHVATHGFARYRLPVMPVVFLFAAAAWCARREGPLAGRRRTAALVLAALFALILVPSIRTNIHHPAFGASEGATPPSEESPSQ